MSWEHILKKDDYDRVYWPIRKKIDDKLDEVVQKNLSNYGPKEYYKELLPTEEEANRVQGILQRELSAFLPSVLPNTQIKVTFKLRNPRTEYPKDYTCKYVITGKGLGEISEFDESRTYGQFGSRWISDIGS